MTQENTVEQVTETIPGTLADYDIIDPPFTVRRVLSPEQVGALMADLNPARVATRQQGGQTLSYLESFDVRATLIRVFGFGGWSEEVLESRILDIRDDGRQGQYASGEKQGQNKTPYVLAYARVRLTIHNIGPAGQDVVFTESAIGSNDGWQIGEVADNSIKTAASDALKRCAINLGTAFGLSLYAKGSRQDVVRVLLEPEQQALLAQWREEQEAKRNKLADAQVNHALGGERVEEVVSTVPGPDEVKHDEPEWTGTREVTP